MSSPLNYLIAGGSGFIGSNIANYLQRTGSGNVTFVSRSAALPKHLANLGKCMTWKDLEANGIPENTDVVMCFTGNNCFYPFSNLYADNLVKSARASRVLTTVKLADLIKKSQKPPKLFVAASAISSYPINKSYDRFFYSDYDTDYEGRGFLAEITQDIETACQFPKSFKTRAIVPRLGVVLGRESIFLKAHKYLYKAQMGCVFGEAKSYFHWIHIDDVVNGLMYLIHLNLQMKDNDPKLNTVTGPVNFVSRPEGECTNTTFYEAIGWSLGRETLFFINNPFLNLVYHRDIADQMNQENKIFPEKLTDVGYDFKFNSVDDAIDDCVL